MPPQLLLEVIYAKRRQRRTSLARHEFELREPTNGVWVDTTQICHLRARRRGETTLNNKGGLTPDVGGYDTAARTCDRRSDESIRPMGGVTRWTRPVQTQRPSLALTEL